MAYHHGDLREALIGAGLELARDRGPQAVVVREAARMVGVSHNAAYRHFADRDQLLAGIAEHAMVLLTAAMDRRMAEAGTGGDDRARAMERVRATGRGYVDFAVEQPGLFRVLFTSFPDAPPTVPDPRQSEVTTPLDVLTRALDELDAAGGVDPARRASAELLCWSAAHGFAALYVDGPLKGSADADRDAELEQVLDAIEAALSRGPGG